MATDFLGLQMVITLRDPSERLCGSVCGVVAGQSLTLRNVWSLDTRQWQEQAVLDPANIADIVDAAKVPGAAAFASQPRPKMSSPAAPPKSAAAFTDPAILAFKSRPTGEHQPLPSSSKPDDKKASKSPREKNSSIHRTSRTTTSPTSTSRERLVEVSLDNLGGGISQDLGPPSSQPQDIAQKRRRRRRPSRGTRATPDTGQPDGSPVRVVSSGRGGQGWRQTPILQSTSSFQPFASLKKGGLGQENGWASEDVTDVQEMGDFDFEEALSKFDKRGLFDQMRREDKVDEADRLVSHNRRSAPKSANLQFWENVLDPQPAIRNPPSVGDDFWNSDADDGPGTAARERGSRQSSRKGGARVPVGRRSQSRKASAISATQGPVRVNSGGISTHSHQAPSRGRLGPNRADEKRPVPGFYLSASGRRVEAVSALQMLNLENIARDDLRLTEDMMTENAGRGIAEVVLAALADPAVKLRQAAQPGRPPPAVASPSPIPTVVVLAGNNKSGSRAVAAARHLRNRRTTVLVCVTGLERGERELLEEVRQQVRLFRAFGGHVYSKSELFEHLRKASILPTLTVDTPRHAATAKPPAVTLIVDALLGLAISFDELRTGDQTTVYELVEWANRNDAFVVAVDVPTGLDPSSGAASVVDGSRLYVRPRYVVAVGAPKTGLLLAASGGDGVGDGLAGDAAASDDTPADWRFYVADMGLGAAVWKKAGAKFRRGIDFDDGWVLEMRYQGKRLVDEDHD